MSEQHDNVIDPAEDRAKFSAMEEGTQEDWGKIAAHFGPLPSNCPTV